MIRFLLLLLFSVSAFATDIQLSWEAPTQYEDGSTLNQIDRYNLYYTIDNVVQDVIQVPATSTEYTLVDVAQGTHVFQISTVTNGTESELSNPVSTVISDKKPMRIQLTIQVVE